MKNLNFDLRAYHSFFKEVPATTVQGLINAVLFPVNGKCVPAQEISWEFITREKLVETLKIPYEYEKDGSICWEALCMERELVFQVEFVFDTPEKRAVALDAAFSIGEADLIVEWSSDRNPFSLYVWFC